MGVPWLGLDYAVEPTRPDLDDLLSLSIEADKLQAVLKIEPSEPCLPIPKESICNYLDEQGIDSRTIHGKAIEELLEAYAQDPSQLHEMVIAKATLPDAHLSERVEFSDSIQTQIEKIVKHEQRCTESESTPSSQTDEGQAVDFYDESPFLIISKDQLIGKRADPHQGKDGIDVTGGIMPAENQEKASDLSSETIRVEPDDHVYAQISGQLIFDTVIIEVLDTLEIKSSVDFTTGNIKFPNDVIINEGVRDLFSVTADGHVEIKKLVEASTIVSGKDTTLLSGMAGRDTGSISTGGSLIAGYLDGVHATIQKDCRVTKEITNCHLDIAGKIDSPSTALRGGETIATNGGVINSAGSEQGVETDIIIGSLPKIEEQITLALQLKAQVKSTLSKQAQELEMFKGNMGKPSELQLEQINEMETEIANLQRKVDPLNEAIRRLRVIIFEFTTHRFTVRSTIYAKTKLWLPGYRVCFDKDVKGELTIDLDDHNEPIIIRSDTPAPLRSIAKVNPDERVLPFTAPMPETIEPEHPDAEDAQDAQDTENQDDGLAQAA